MGDETPLKCVRFGFVSHKGIEKGKSMYETSLKQNTKISDNLQTDSVGNTENYDNGFVEQTIQKLYKTVTVLIDVINYI